jgi:hypothetical protein
MYNKDLVYQSKIIKEVCNTLAKQVIKKNVSYGGSIFRENPLMRGKSPSDTIKTEIGHKLNRLVFGNNDYEENDLIDLLGYIILLEVEKKLQEEL